MINYKQISNSDGEKLVKAARKVVTEYLKNGRKLDLGEDFESRFSFNAGIFVTLNDPNGLRGCIGYPLPNKKLCKVLADAAISAAIDDPRFEAVELTELEKIMFEVTVLSEPEKIVVNNPNEYPSKIKVGRDGLIIKSGLHSGLLLPQVPVEYNWNEQQFLEHTCEKAGLPSDYWKNPQIEILKFEGIVFKEENPNGNVVKAAL